MVLVSESTMSFRPKTSQMVGEPHVAFTLRSAVCPRKHPPLLPPPRPPPHPLPPLPVSFHYRLKIKFSISADWPDDVFEMHCSECVSQFATPHGGHPGSGCYGRPPVGDVAAEDDAAVDAGRGDVFDEEARTARGDDRGRGRRGEDRRSSTRLSHERLHDKCHRGQSQGAAANGDNTIFMFVFVG